MAAKKTGLGKGLDALFSTPIVEEVKQSIDACHISDIKVAHKCQSEHDYIQLVLTILNKLFNAESQERKPHKCIDPHRIMLLNNGVRTH